MARVRLSDVARAAGVSTGTVSNALNHPERVAPEKLARVERAVKDLGYVPSQSARRLAGGESQIIGLVLPRLDHAFSLQIASGAQDESHARGFDLLIASAGNDDILENHYMRYFVGCDVRGVLTQPMTTNTWDPPAGQGLPLTVYLDVHGRGQGLYVAADNEEQGRMMLEHAVACGARHVAVVGEAAFTQLSLRVQGVEQAANKYDLTLERIERGDWNTVADGFELGCELVRRSAKERPDFVIGLTDTLAAGIIEGLLAAGLRVPDDILVAGCDGNQLAWGGPVSLTTLSSPGYEMGRKGVELLLSEEGVGNAMRQELVGSTLLVRESTSRA